MEALNNLALFLPSISDVLRNSFITLCCRTRIMLGSLISLHIITPDSSDPGYCNLYYPRHYCQRSAIKNVPPRLENNIRIGSFREPYCTVNDWPAHLIFNGLEKQAS